MTFTLEDLKKLGGLTTKTDNAWTVITITNYEIPSLETVKKHCEENNYEINYEEFINYYGSKDWKINGNPIKSWKYVAWSWYQKDNKKKSNKDEVVNND